eukprot:1162031-Pelagomonas_calceolata.AAC.5
MDISDMALGTQQGVFFLASDIFCNPDGVQLALEVDTLCMLVSWKVTLPASFPVFFGSVSQCASFSLTVGVQRLVDWYYYLANLSRAFQNVEAKAGHHLVDALSTKEDTPWNGCQSAKCATGIPMLES